MAKWKTKAPELPQQSLRDILQHLFRRPPKWCCFWVRFKTRTGYPQRHTHELPWWKTSLEPLSQPGAVHTRASCRWLAFSWIPPVSCSKGKPRATMFYRTPCSSDRLPRSKRKKMDFFPFLPTSKHETHIHTHTWSLHDPLKMGSLAKIMGSWSPC